MYMFIFIIATLNADGGDPEPAPPAPRATAFGPGTRASNVPRGANGRVTGGTSYSGRGVLEAGGSNTVNCTDNSNYMALNQILTLMDDPEGMRIGIVKGSGNSEIQVSIPSYISNCTDINLELKQDGNNLYLSARNIRAGSPNNNAYMRCMEQQQVLQNKNGRLELNRSSASAVRRQTVKNFKIDPSKLVDEKPIRAYFLSGQHLVGPNSSWGIAYERAAEQGFLDRCLIAEEMSQDGVVVYASDLSLRLKSIEDAACCTDDIGVIANAFDSLGNIIALHGTTNEILEVEKKLLNNYLKVLRDEVYAKESQDKLRGFADQIRKQKKGENCSSVKSVARNMGTLIRDISDNYINKLVIGLRNLDERIDLDEEHRREIEAYTREYRDYIKGFSGDEYISKSVLERVASCGDEERVVEMCRFKHTAEVYGSSGDTVIPAGADETIRKKTAACQKDAEIRREQYEITNEGETYSPKYERLAAQSQSRQQQVYSQWTSWLQSCSQYCSNGFFGFQNNAARCNACKNNYQFTQRQAMTAMNRYNTAYQQYAGIAQNFASQEAAYAQKQQEEMGSDYFLFGGSFGLNNTGGGSYMSTLPSYMQNYQSQSNFMMPFSNSGQYTPGMYQQQQTMYQNPQMYQQQMMYPQYQQYQQQQPWLMYQNPQMMYQNPQMGLKYPMMNQNPQMNPQMPQTGNFQYTR